MILISTSLSFSQVSINTDGSAPDNSSILDVKSTEKGFLPPRMTTTEIGNIESPANGLFVFNTSDSKAYIFVSEDNEWKEVYYGTGTILPPWSCGYAFLDSRDGQFYSTVQIGTQCWMAENLNIGTMIVGTSNQINNATIEKYCYHNQEDSCNVYGGLYQWDEMMQYVASGTGVQGICPLNWHLPTDDEWKILEMHLGMIQSQADAVGWRGTNEGGKMKEAGIVHWWHTNYGATNSSGFTALPGGLRYLVGSFGVAKTYGIWWSSSESSGGEVWLRRLIHNNALVERDEGGKGGGLSVTCIKD